MASMVIGDVGCSWITRTVANILNVLPFMMGDGGTVRINKLQTFAIQSDVFVVGTWCVKYRIFT